MNSIFCKKKQTNIKINAHNKKNRLVRKTPWYTSLHDKITHNVCVVIITKLKNLQKTQKLETTQVAQKKRFHGAKESIMQERLQCKNIYDIKESVMQGQLQCKNVCDIEELRRCKNNCNGRTSIMQKNQ